MNFCDGCLFKALLWTLETLVHLNEFYELQKRSFIYSCIVWNSQRVYKNQLKSYAYEEITKLARQKSSNFHKI